MRVRILIAAVCILTAFASARPEPGFDPKAVVRQVRNAGRDASDVERLASDAGEFLIDTSGVHSEGYPAVAFDGANFLVVWDDARSGNSDIYGARVTTAGTVLDPDGFVISQAASWQEFPAVGFDGANFLVVWMGAPFDTSGICGARVTPGGTVLDPSGIVISQAVSRQELPAVGFDGANFLVVWTGIRGDGDYDVYGARVTPGGTVLDPQGIVISQAEYGQYLPALGFDGTNFLVVWGDGRSGNSDIYGARVTTAGTVLDPDGFVISQAANGQVTSDLGFDGTNFLVVWHDWRNDPDTSDIYGARVSPAGTVLDPSGIAISMAANSQHCPVVAFDGTSFLVVWNDLRNWRNTHDTSDIYGARMTPQGTVYNEGLVVRQEGNQWYPALARGTGSQMFLVYQGWAGTVGGKAYNTYRIWGKMDPVPGIEETMNEERGTLNLGPNVVRSVLFLAGASSLKPQTAGSLLDISGRKVLDLRPGANDVSRLSPGVYFVRAASGVTRIVITR